MTEIALVNTYRIEQFWQIILDQLMVISVCSNEDFRSLAIEAFMIIILEILLKKEMLKDASSAPQKAKKVEEAAKVKQKPKVEDEETKLSDYKSNSAELVD